MSAIPKDTILNYISASWSEFLKSFNPVALLGLTITALVLVLLPVFILLRRYAIVGKIYNKVFWNMLIRVL